MFKLESNRLKREFKITNGNFYASQILNKYSGMSFVPDGNGSEFIIHFADGEELSAKGLPVIESSDENDKLKFVFAQSMGVTVTVEYWVHTDGNTICKQLTLSQSDDRVIDYAILDNIGIINSKTHFSVDIMEDSEINGVYASLGQPFYIDSLFFGCEFPAADNRIVHGAGQVKYYIGKNVGKSFSCPVAVMGGGKDNTIVEVRKAFFEYIDFISQNVNLRFQYNSWYDGMLKIDEQSIRDSFARISKGLAFSDAPKLDAYVIDDGWNNYKSKFWSFDEKKFPNGLDHIAADVKKMGSGFGLWLGPRGGYDYQKKFAKKIQKGGFGYLNKNSQDICVASTKYLDNLEKFLIDTTCKYDIDYLKLDGFCLKPCTDESHDHAIGGENEMYFVTDMWHKWIKLFENLRASRKAADKSLWINMTCYVNVSPWWLQWVNSIWLQNSGDIGFADNYEEQPRVEAEITYRDGRYFDCICRRANQIPLKNIYNHEPIYGTNANVEYTDEEFEKFLYWCAVRGQALNELYLSYTMMNEQKWASLARVMNFQKDNYHILKNAVFIGGDPVDNNIYGYISWNDDGEGIIALRNPTKEKTSLTLNLNKLMGVPESLTDVKRYNIYNNSMPETDELFSYGSKIDLTMHQFEIMIFKFTK
ncbi:MAG: hypothetical protein ACLUFN_06145 [Eubacterium sp.]